MRDIRVLRDGWRFGRYVDDADAVRPDLDDRGWAEVRVPHDWAIAGPFNQYYDVHLKPDASLGRDVVKTGRTGGLPHVGAGWYRLRVALPDLPVGGRVTVEFDGVMSHSQVFLDGHPIGGWPCGYTSFACDATSVVRSGQVHLLAVRAENKPLSTRWYPGAGLYRPVRLVLTGPVHVARHGTCIRTPEVAQNRALVRIETRVENHGSRSLAAEVAVRILDSQGREAACASKRTTTQAARFRLIHSVPIASPRFWDIEDPHLYTAVTTVLVDGVPVDETETLFGVRNLGFDPNEGFRLNGRRVPLRGVCLHHDLGGLGAAVNTRAIERQVEIMKDMGANAIRTSHNPPAVELLDVCDRLGMLVLVEAFDAWRVPAAGMPFAYPHLFDAWAEKDLAALIRRDRNHPSVIMWSIGNEVADQRIPQGRETAALLTAICHREDPTRPVTAAFSDPDAAIANGLAAAVDIPGWNYQWPRYAELHREHPDWPILGTETDSCVSSRGVYHLPIVEHMAERFHRCTRTGSFPRPPLGTYHIDALAAAPDTQCSSYDCGGACPPDYEFAAQDDLPFVLGQFVWTGFDYLGEPTPFHEAWPSRSSYFGIVDTCGFPKDRYFLYQARWSGRRVLHLLPHWTWPGREGTPIPVMCYTDAPSAELFLNGRSLGVRRKNRDSVHERYRLIWDEVIYEPGELRAVALDETGRPRGECRVRTAGQPAAVHLAADRQTIAADGDDLCFVTVTVRDACGDVHPTASNLVKFTVTGPGELIAVDNGDPTSVESFQAPRRLVFNGYCLAVVRSIAGRPGEIRLAARTAGLTGAGLSIDAVK